MHEAYVSFEVAKLLKEKGFDIPCRYTYHGDIKSAPFFHRKVKNFNGEEYSGKTTEWFSCPTHQMAMAWLRKKYNIYISIQPDFPSDKDYKMCWCWSASILYENSISTKGYQCYIETYEEAVESALKYTLENLI